MSEREALLRTIRESPHDDAPRLVFADWLDETGIDANAARAEFIRLQCREAKWLADEGVPRFWDCAPRSWYERTVALRRQHGEAWLAELSPLPQESRSFLYWFFHRGFSAGFVGVRTTFGDHAADLIGTAVGECNFATSPPSFRAIRPLSQPWFAAVTSLWIEDNGFSFNANEFNESIFIDSLQQLCLSGQNLPQDEVRSLWESPRLAQIRSLGLSYFDLRHEGLVALTASPHVGGMRALQLGGNQISLAGAIALARSPMSRSLEWLDLTNNPLGQAGAEHLGNATFSALTALKLERAMLGTEGVTELARSSAFPALRWLHLGANHLQDAAVEWLLRCGVVRRLRGLLLPNNVLTDAAVLALAGSPDARNLVALDLDFNRLTESSAVAIAESPHLEGLTHVALRGRQTWPPRVRKLLERRFGACLRSI